MAKTLQHYLEIEAFRFDRNIEKFEEEVSVFYEIYLKLLCNHQELSFDKIHQSLKNIRSYKNHDIEEHEIVDFEEKYDRYAYIFSYCVIHSVVMYDRFFDMMKDNPSMVKKVISMKKLNVCILGGGPAFEAIAIGKLLNNILAQNGPNKRPPLQLYFTVIDICGEWETEASYFIESAKNMLWNDNLLVDFSFIAADLTENFSTNVAKAIKNAHFVIMHKFLSEINEAYIEKKLITMIDKIIESMSYKSCLFFLDNSGGGVFKKIDKNIDFFPCTFKIYGPSFYNSYKLDLETLEKFSNGLKHFFRFLKCTCQTTVSCSAWIKIRDILNLELLPLSLEEKKPASLLKAIEKEKCKEKHEKVKIKKILQTHKKKGVISVKGEDIEMLEEKTDFLELEELPLNIEEKKPASLQVIPASLLKAIKEEKCEEKHAELKNKKKRRTRKKKCLLSVKGEDVETLEEKTAWGFTEESDAKSHEV